MGGRPNRAREAWSAHRGRANRSRGERAADVAHTVKLQTESRGRDVPSRILAQNTHSGIRHLVLSCLALLVVVRFFTEVVPVVPRAANFADIPILIALVAAAIAHTRRPSAVGTNYLPLGGPILAFLLICSVSAVLNPSRTAIGPALVFIYGILAPLGVYAAVYRLWSAGWAASMSRLLVTLGVIQLAVVALIDLPRFIATGDPDRSAVRSERTSISSSSSCFCSPR